MFREVVSIVLLCAVCITAQSGRSSRPTRPTGREELVAVEMDLMGSDYERTTKEEADELSREVAAMMDGSGLSLGQVEVGPSDPPPQHRARRWRVTIRIRIWIFTIEINIGRKKRATADDAVELVRKALAERREMIGQYEVDTSSISLVEPNMYRGSATMDIPLSDAQYDHHMMDSSSRVYQSIAGPIQDLLNQRPCFLSNCEVRVILIYCYPHVHVIVVHCHHYHLWWLRNQIRQSGAVGGYTVNTGAISISNGY